MVEGIENAKEEVLKALRHPVIIDARDPEDITQQKGGPAIEGSVNVPFNMNGVKQADRPTTLAEYKAKLEAAGCLPADVGAAIITHCGSAVIGSGGRGGKSAAVLREMGYKNVHNGGSPDHIRTIRAAGN